MHYRKLDQRAYKANYDHAEDARVYGTRKGYMLGWNYGVCGIWKLRGNAREGKL